MTNRQIALLASAITATPSECKYVALDVIENADRYFNWLEEGVADALAKMLGTKYEKLGR